MMQIFPSPGALKVRRFRAKQPDPLAIDRRRYRFEHVCPNPACRRSFLGRRVQIYCSVACKMAIVWRLGLAARVKAGHRFKRKAFRP